MASQMEDRRGCFGRLGATTWANRCALPMCHREEEERSTRKKEEEAAEQQQQHRRWRDGVVGVVDVEEDSWQVNGHEHLARPSYHLGQLSHVSRVPRCPFSAAAVRHVPPPPLATAITCLHVTFTSRFNASAYATESCIVRERIY